MYCGQGSVALLWGARGCCRRPAARALRHVCPAENIPGARTYMPLAGLSRCCCCTRAPIVACPRLCRQANAASGLCSPPLSRADELCTIANMLALQPGAFEFSRGCTCTGKSLRTGSRTRRRPPGSFLFVAMQSVVSRSHDSGSGRPQTNSSGLSMYEQQPTTELTLYDFEVVALNRLRGEHGVLIVIGLWRFRRRCSRPSAPWLVFCCYRLGA